MDAWGGGKSLNVKNRGERNRATKKKVDEGKSTGNLPAHRERCQLTNPAEKEKNARQRHEAERRGEVAAHIRDST